MSLFDHPEFDRHEQVLYCHDASTGLRGIIAIHSTALGPAAGGCRMYPYATVDDALTDVLRLSRGMSYKNALAGLPLGGGKCVVIADPARRGKADLLCAFARHVQALGGRYWTAIDIGVDPQDADIMAERCDYVFARASQYPAGFSPSFFTARGGLAGIRATAKHVLKREDLRGVRVAVQGLGATGDDLCRRLHAAGAALVVADIKVEAVRAVVDATGALAVDPAAIHAQDVDIFAPCAMGAVINDATVPELRARAICGLANNQLAAPRHGAALHRRGIAYVPDYIVNAGGMIGASGAIVGPASAAAADPTRCIEGLYDTVLQILRDADAQGRPPSEIADDLARARIAAGKPRG